MDLRFTSEENAFREEVRSFIKENLPEGIRKKAVVINHYTDVAEPRICMFGTDSGWE